MLLSNVKAKVIQGLFWNAVQLVINRAFGFIIKLVLAKLLFPEQFGLVGMATVFTSFVGVFNDLGIGAALVQKKDENLTEAHYHTSFWTGVLWSVGIFLIVSLIVAPLAANFYNEPEIGKIIPVLSLSILSGPINLVHHAKLTKQLNFKKLAFISNASSIFSGVLSLILAYLGVGVWALVFNSVATIVVAMPLYFNASHYIPKLVWSKQAFIDIFGFGVYTTGTGIFNKLISQLDYLLIGKLLGASALGTYTLAFVLTDTFKSQMTYMMNKVMYPIYGQKQDDKIALKKYYLQVVKYNSLIIYPIMVILISLGEPFIMNVFGKKWSGTVIPLKILSVSILIHMAVNSHSSLIRGLGEAKLEMKLQFIKALFIYAPLITTGIYYLGINGAALAFLIGKIFEVIIAQYYLNKLLNIHVLELLYSLKIPLIAGIISFFTSYILLKIGVHYTICASAILILYGLIVWKFMSNEIKSNLKQFKI